MTANPAIVDAVNRIFTQVQTIITKRMSQAGIHQSSINAAHLRGTPPSTVIKSVTASPSAVFGASGTNHSQGVVPDPGAVAGITRFLREDATWDTTGGGVSGAVFAITVGFDGGGSVITTGKIQDVYLDFGGTITSWTLLADQAGSCDINIWKAAYSSFPPVAGGSITGGADPSLTSQTKNQSSSLAGWTTAFSAGDVLRFKVASISVCTRLLLELTFTRS